VMVRVDDAPIRVDDIFDHLVEPFLRAGLRCMHGPDHRTAQLVRWRHIERVATSPE
jgi:hypothetical protein